MNTGTNNIVTLLAGGQSLPPGWGWPPTVPQLIRESPLRRFLMFLQDEDGRSQLCRWYFGLLRAFPPVWRQLTGVQEGYTPSMFSRPIIESPTLTFCRDIQTGAQVLGWRPGPDVTHLTGTLYTVERRLLLGTQSHRLQIGQDLDTGRYAVVWPDFLKLLAGLVDLGAADQHEVHFRPAQFDEKLIAARVLENSTDELERSGCLASFLSLPRAADKLAVAWLAVSILDSRV